jgi:hypothetical protein
LEWKINQTITYTIKFGRQITKDVQAPPDFKNMAEKPEGTAEMTHLVGTTKLNRKIELILYRILNRDGKIGCLYHPQMGINQKGHDTLTQYNQKAL